jgi:hypothetical protein
MRDNISAISPAFVAPPPRESRLDYGLLQRIFLVFGIFLLLISPFSRDPLAFAIGALAPWVILRLVGRPNMPAAVAYFLLWQWLQCFARVVQGLVDGEALAGGLFGPTVEQAYWYTLAGVMAEALAFRLVMSGLRAAPPELANVHRDWHLRDLCVLYVGTLAFAAMCSFAARIAQSLDQPVEAASHLKILALVMLFSNVLSTGKGMNVLVGVLLAEVFTGFTGLFSDFKGVFIYVAITALAVRVKWTGTMAVAAVALGSCLLGLALFWTAVKGDFREFATASSDSQNIRTSLSTRMDYLGDKAAAAGTIDWDFASYALLTRLAYVDILGSVIGVQQVSPESRYMGQWSDALEHVLKPRFLFPDKAALSDTEVFVRLARANSSEQLRLGTSISVGFMAENYVDLGFPGMLAGIFALGAMAAGICRYFMTRPIPRVMREGSVLAILYSVGHDGVEISLPKLLGALLMTFIVWAIMAKWGFTPVIRWLARHGDVRKLQPA